MTRTSFIIRVNYLRGGAIFEQGTFSKPVQKPIRFELPTEEKKKRTIPSFPKQFAEGGGTSILHTTPHQNLKKNTIAIFCIPSNTKGSFGHAFTASSMDGN